MAFGRAKPEEPVAQVAREGVREFTLGTVERPATRKRNRIGWGAKAIRVPQGSKDDRVFAPCAYVGTGNLALFWRIEQPEQPEIVGRTEWLSGEPRDIAARAAGKVFDGVLDVITGFGAEGGDQPTKDRVLEWRAGTEVVMTSEGAKSVSIKAEWLDRRLAFAYLLIAD